LQQAEAESGCRLPQSKDFVGNFAKMRVGFGRLPWLSGKFRPGTQWLALKKYANCLPLGSYGKIRKLLLKFYNSKSGQDVRVIVILYLPENVVFGAVIVDAKPTSAHTGRSVSIP